MKRVIICEDGFVWHILTKSEAKGIFKSKVMQLYALFDEHSERMITSEDEIDSCFRMGAYVCLEVGFLNDMENKQ